MTYSRIAGLVPAVAACLVATSVHATDIAAAGPQVSAAQLIAAHGATTAPTLHIIYNTSSNSEPGKLTVDIAPDFVVVKQTASKEGAASEALYDFRLKRAISIDEAHHTFSNDSAYMMVDFRYIESYNRKMLRRVLTNIGISKQLPQANPFWDQQSLGFLRSMMTSRRSIRSRHRAAVWNI